MKYKGIIYDLDGTLLDTRLDIANSINRTIVAMGGQPVENDLIYKHVGHGLDYLVKGTIPDCDAAKVKEGVAFFTKDYFENLVVETDFYPGAREMVDEMKARGMIQAVYTNKPHDFTLKMFDEMNIQNLFSTVLGAENGFPDKPARDGADWVLGQMGLPADDVLFIGDTLVDLETALGVGMDCALVSGGYCPFEKLKSKEADTIGVFEDFQKLSAQLLKN